MAILPLASLERAMPIISCLFMYAAYPACSLWLFLPIHCMRLILPAHYGDSMPMMASPKGAMPPGWLQLITLWLLSKEQCRHYSVPSPSEYLIPSASSYELPWYPALIIIFLFQRSLYGLPRYPALILIKRIFQRDIKRIFQRSASLYPAYVPTRYSAYIPTQRSPISSVSFNAISSVSFKAVFHYIAYLSTQYSVFHYIPMGDKYQAL